MSVQTEFEAWFTSHWAEDRFPANSHTAIVCREAWEAAIASHQSSLAERELRIAELATDTIEVLKVVEALGPDARCAVCGTRFDHKTTCVIGNTMKRARAALAATEESKP